MPDPYGNGQRIDDHFAQRRHAVSLLSRQRLIQVGQDIVDIFNAH
jgi:hypothetical protein